MSYTQTTAYWKRYRHDQHRGIARMLDTAPVRAHIEACHAAGMSYRSIAATAGVSPQAVLTIKDGRRTCKPRIAAGILGVKPAIARITTRDAKQPDVPRRGVSRRIQALLVMGWSHADMQFRSGIRTHVVLSQRGDVVRLATFEAIEAMYRDLSNRRGPSKIATSRALKRGYLSPVMWDDIDLDDEPDLDLEPVDGDQVDEIKVQRVLNGERHDCNHAERAEICRRMPDSDTSWAELERITGWNVHREKKRSA